MPMQQLMIVTTCILTIAIIFISSHFIIAIVSVDILASTSLEGYDTSKPAVSCSGLVARLRYETTSECSLRDAASSRWRDGCTDGTSYRPATRAS